MLESLVFFLFLWNWALTHGPVPTTYDAAFVTKRIETRDGCIPVFAALNHDSMKFLVVRDERGYKVEVPNFGDLEIDVVGCQKAYFKKGTCLPEAALDCHTGWIRVDDTKNPRIEKDKQKFF